MGSARYIMNGLGTHRWLAKAKQGTNLGGDRLASHMALLLKRLRDGLFVAQAAALGARRSARHSTAHTRFCNSSRKALASNAIGPHKALRTTQSENVSDNRDIFSCCSQLALPFAPALTLRFGSAARGRQECLFPERGDQSRRADLKRASTLPADAYRGMGSFLERECRVSRTLYATVEIVADLDVPSTLIACDSEPLSEARRMSDEQRA